MAKSKAQKKLGGPRIGGDGPRQAKADAVQEVQTRVQEASAVLLTEYRGMTVQELAELRTGLREAEADYKVYKNTLAKLAVDQLGLSELKPYLEGPVAFTFAKGDPVSAAKAIAGFAKRVQTLVVKVGLLEGKILSDADVNALAELDSREVMLTKTAGMFQAPLQRAASLLAAGFQQMGGLLVQLRDKLPAEAAPEAPAPEAPATEAPEAEAPAGDEASAPEAASEAPEEASGESGQDEPGTDESQQG